MDIKKRKQYRPIVKGVFYNFNNEYYFGHCLCEDHENFFVNIGEENWFYCPICKIKWQVGWGLLSDPPENVAGNLTTYWRKNKNLLENYEDCS